MTYELVDFGNQCLPHELIRKILKKKSKQLFMLGVYSFNDISVFLERGNFEDIYKKEYLVYNNCPIEHFTNEVEKYSHSSIIKNTRCKFTYNHDFLYDISTNTIRNYDFIVHEFDEKIANLKQLFSNDKLPIFIHFSMIKITGLEKMVSVLKSYMTKPFYIFIFVPDTCYPSNRENNNTLFENIKFIYLEKDYIDWWKQPQDIKMVLYKEIYDKYVDIMRKLQIEDNLISFEELDIKI
jgi:hypothetical protein